MQRQIPHYRNGFFAKLSVQAEKAGLDISVYSGSAPADGASCGFRFRVLLAKFLTGEEKGPYWLSGLTRAIKGADIVIAPQELQCLNVPYLWARRHTLCRHWIWWGHGYNFQAKVRKNRARALQEAAKHFMTKRGDGLITYTESGARYWRQRGMAADRVRPHFNTLDVEGLLEAGAQVSKDAQEQVKHQLGLEGKQVLLFSGRLYPEKEVDFLLKSFALLEASHSNIALLILGDGSERTKLEKLRDALHLRHVHFLGEHNDPVQTSVYFQLADLLVIPGLVGLAIVHGFAYGLPIVTTNHDFHSPEIEYLSSENGLKTAHDIKSFASGIAAILSKEELLGSMQLAARLSGNRLTLSRSVQHFTEALLTFSNSHRPKNT